MEIGIFSRTYETKSLTELFRKMTSQGIYCTQFNLCSAGMPTLPPSLEEKALIKIGETAKRYKVRLCALSGTFNMIDPDEGRRERGFRLFENVCRAASLLDIPMVTLCTGSKNPQDKWKWHPANLLSASWDDLMRSTQRVLACAERYSLILGVEPEVNNIVCSPQKARLYLDAVKSPRLKIVMDAANLFSPDRRFCAEDTLSEAFAMLGKDIALAHAKDIVFPNEAAGPISFTAAGRGDLDFDAYIGLLNGCGYTGPLVLHGLSEDQAEKSADFLRKKIAGGTTAQRMAMRKNDSGKDGTADEHLEK